MFYFTLQNEVKAGKPELQATAWKVTQNCHKEISKADGCNPARATLQHRNANLRHTACGISLYCLRFFLFPRSKLL
jgi:hypothetical protein